MTVLDLHSSEGEAASEKEDRSQKKNPKVVIPQETKEQSAVSESEEAADQSSSDQSPAPRLARCYRFLARLPQERPRSYAIIFKIIVPQFALIFLSMVFGYLLALLEAPEEIKQNNLAIAVQESFYRVDYLERFFMREGPAYCTTLYLQERLGLINIEDLENQLVVALDEVVIMLYQEGLGAVTDILKNTTMPDNDEFLATLSESNVTKIDDVPSFFQFMTSCGAKMEELTELLSIRETFTSAAYDINDISVTFNWIKCPDALLNETDSEAEFLDVFRLTSPGFQEEVVVERWRESRNDIYAEYFSLYEKYPNMTLLQAKERAIKEAYLGADGFQGCIPDTVASAWFWFVVMTTVGYGNASPVSTGGRALVFIFGSLCLVCFGTVLARASDQVLSIFDEAVDRCPKLKWLSIPWVEIIFWGVLLFSWMTVIAACTISWKKVRAAEEMDFSDAYWFAFISITTVGLGDYYLNTEEFAARDILAFAMLFLIGFVLLGNFFLKLTDWARIVSRHGRVRSRTTGIELEDQPPLHIMPEESHDSNNM